MSSTNLYAVRDKIKDCVLCVFSAENDGVAIRENVVNLSKVLPLGDLELSRVGVIDDMCIVSATPVTVVSWDSYKFPESPFKVSKMEGENERKNS